MLDSGERSRCTTCGQELFLDPNESVQLLPEKMYLIDTWLANGRQEIGLAPNIISYAKRKQSAFCGNRFESVKRIISQHLPYCIA